MNDVKLDFDDVMIVPQFTDVTSRKQVKLSTNIKGVWGQTLSGVPIIAANMHGVGTFNMAKSLYRYGMFTAIEKNTSIKEWFDFFSRYGGDDTTWYYPDGENKNSRATLNGSVFLTLGMGESDIRNLKMLVAAKCFEQMKIVIDVANGYMNPFYDYIKQVRDIAPDSFILAGTICTPEAADRIVRSGADLARVGIGSGAVCTTRQVAGVGYPQASAIMECNNSPIVCDGGCTHPGDFAKAFALGSDMIMAGSVFAGHREGEVKPDDNLEVVFYGMSSHLAQESLGKRKEYRSSEGRVVKIPYRGEVSRTAEHILGGIRSACAYSNCFNLESLSTKAKIIRVNNQLNRSLEKYTI